MQKLLLSLALAALWGCTPTPQIVAEIADPAADEAIPLPENTVQTTETPADLVVGEEAAAAFDAAVEPLRPVLPDFMGAMGALEN